MGLLVWVGIAIRDGQLFIEKIGGLSAHTEFRRGQRAVGKLLRLVEEAIRGHGVKNLDGAPRFLTVMLFPGQTVSQNRGPRVEAADGVVCSGPLGTKG